MDLTRKKQTRLTVGMFLLGIGAFGVFGQTYRTWDNGHSSDDWSQNNNWSSNNRPNGNTEVARFSNGNASTTSIDINSNQRTGGMLFDANLTVDITFTRANRELSIRNGDANYGIINNSVRTITFENQTSAEENMTWAATNASGGGLVFDGEVDPDGNIINFDTVNLANFITINGTISGAGGISKEGEGILTLTGTNTFTGTIDVNGGVLSISSQENLGDLSASSNLTLNGGTLRIDGGTVDNDDNTRVLVLGAGGGTIDTVAGSDTLIWDNNISGSGDLTKIGAGTFRFDDPTTFTGDLNINEGTVEFGGGDNRLVDSVDVTIASGATLDVLERSDDFGSLSGAGTLTSSNSTSEIVGFGLNNTDTEFSGTITEGLNIEKLGSGNMILSGNNTFTGSATVVDGTLTLASANALGTTADDTTVNSGATLALTNNISVGEAIANSGTVTNTSGTNTLTGNITGSGTVATDGGQLTLIGNNTYTGDTTVNSGSTLIAASDTALGNASNDTTVNSGGTLGLDGGVTITQANVNLAGTGNGAAGALQNISGTNQLIGNFALTADATIQSSAGTLSLGTSPGYNNYATQFIDNAGFDLTVDGAGDTNLYAGYSGSGDLIKEGSGTLLIEGTPNPSSATTFTGETFVNEGEVILSTLYNDAPGVGPLDDFFIFNDVTVGDGTGAAGSATLTFGINDAGAGNDYANIFDDGVNLTVNSDGSVDTRGHTQYVQNVTLDGGSITTEYNGGADEGTLFITGSISSTNTSQIATIDGEINLNDDSAKVIDVATNSTLDIDARIVAGGFEKTGDGTLILSGANTFGGTADISSGIVRVDNDLGLGGTSGLGTTNVDTGAQLQLAGVSIASEALTLNGAGIASDGALQAFSGTNSWGGTITLVSDSEINAASGANLTLSGPITGTDRTLTVDGAGDTTFTGSNEYAILDKQGSGTLTIGSSNILDDDLDLTLSGGTFAMAGAISDTIDLLNVSGSGNLDIDGILTMNGGTISGGDGSDSTGNLILTAGNTLNITNDFDFGGTLELTAGTTLALSGGHTFDLGNLNVTGDTVIDFGASSANILNLGSLTIADGVTITVNNWISFQDLWTTGSFSGGSGAVTIDERDGNTAQITFTGFSPADTIWLTEDFGTNEITVPEPSSYGALLMGFGLAAWRLRRPRRLPLS